MAIAVKTCFQMKYKWRGLTWWAGSKVLNNLTIGTEHKKLDANLYYKVEEPSIKGSLGWLQ